MAAQGSAPAYAALPSAQPLAEVSALSFAAAAFAPVFAVVVVQLPLAVAFAQLSSPASAVVAAQPFSQV